MKTPRARHASPASDEAPKFFGCGNDLFRFGLVRASRRVLSYVGASLAVALNGLAYAPAVQAMGAVQQDVEIRVGDRGEVSPFAGNHAVQDGPQGVGGAVGIRLVGVGGRAVAAE